MKLYEFFGKMDINVNSDKNEDAYHMSQEEESVLLDEVFWDILDNDDLHKHYFMPIARELKKIYDSPSKTDDLHDWKVWIPMVNKGCVEYFGSHNLEGDPKDIFNKEFRKDLCKKLTDHYHEDIIKGSYKLGQ